MAVSGDLTTARSCHAAAFAALAACVLLAAAGHWLASGLVLWLVPSLLLVAGQARRAARRTEEGR